MKARLVMVMVTAGVGCKDDAPAVGAPKAQGASGGPFAAWMPKDAAALWEGAWASRLSLQRNRKGDTSMAGDPAAIVIRGDVATVYDGRNEHTLGFSLASPCQAVFTEPVTEGSMKGGTASHGMIFVVKDGALRVGSGAAGYRKGKAALVCSEGARSGVTVVDAAGTCVTWKESFGKLEQAAESCAWSQRDGKDVLTIGTGDWTTTVVADGDTLESEQFTRWVKDGLHARARDFVEAQVTILAKIEEKDPAAQAKKAGGVVGKTDTIVSLVATFASDPDAWKGKPFQITAQYNGASRSTSGDQTTHSANLVDGKDATAFTLGCDLGATPPPEGLAQYDRVVAQGTLDEMFGRPHLRACALTKAP